MLQIANEGPLKVRVQAAVQFGQMVERNWSFTPESGAPEGFVVIDNGDKETVRENLMNCIYSVQEVPQILKQYSRSLIFIVRSDFPGYWPNFIDLCMQFLSQ